MTNIRSALFTFAAISVLFALLSPAVSAEDDTAPTTDGMWQSLLSEKERLTNNAQQLAERVRAKAVEMLGEKETSLKRDVALEEAKLTALKASRIASKERLEYPAAIPLSVLLQIDPVLKELHSKKETLQRQREAVAQALRKPEEDPRVQQFDRQLKELNDKIKAIVDGTDTGQRKEIQNRFRRQEELNLYLIDQQIREQEILVKALQEKLNEQMKESTKRTDDLRENFEQAQFDRSIKILDQIEERIRAIQSTEKGVPDQPVPTMNSNQLRRLNKRLDRIESLLISLQEEQQEIKSAIQNLQ